MMRNSIPKRLGRVTISLLVALCLSLLLLATRIDRLRLPGNHQGFEPEQPIAFSHRLHGGELQIPCLYCHSTAADSQQAGTPAAQLCLNCHRFILAPLGQIREEERRAAEEEREAEPVYSREIEKIYLALGLNWEGESVSEPVPIEWVRVHDLPDFTVFHHGIHEAARISCQECHGAVERMERVRQVETLSMGWCVQCHRDYRGRSLGERVLDPRTDCGVCHY